MCQYNNILKKNTNGRIKKKKATTVATVPSGTVVSVQNLNKRLKKKKVLHQSTVSATVLTQYKHSECTVPKYCSGIGAFII